MTIIIPKNYANWLRALSIQATTIAGSGHPTSCLSAAEIMVGLTSHFVADMHDTQNIYNDRLIFSKGHAAPLLYSWYHTLGAVSREELLTLRKFGSRLEGHPTMNFPYTEAATGSLGQGLGVGLGIVLGQRLVESEARTFVLMGDSELMEGSVWETVQLAAYYHTKNLVALVDLNDLGQTTSPLFASNPERLARVFADFGWKVVVCSKGNDQAAVQAAFTTLEDDRDQPIVLIFHTKKGAGVSLVEGQTGRHGKPFSPQEMQQALTELEIDIDSDSPQITLQSPIKSTPINTVFLSNLEIPLVADTLSVREAYGKTLAQLGGQNSHIIVLDAETSNSTFSHYFAQEYPERYFEMYIAEQNMVSVAVGFSRMGFVPVVNTFGAFLTRAFDQIRMAAYSDARIVLAGSHVGVSIGEDGASQMALEDIAMFRTIESSTVLYPSDAQSAAALTTLAIKTPGIVYLRNTRGILTQRPVQKLTVGGSRTIVTYPHNHVTICAAGVTLDEAVFASTILEKEGIYAQVIDMYSVKPLDSWCIQKIMRETDLVVVVEDHHREGGLYSAICEASGAFKLKKPIISLAVTQTPHSGTPVQLLQHMQIDAAAIVSAIKEYR